MSTLLHLDASPMGDHSVSRHMTSTFVAEWQKAHADGKIITRDISAGLPFVTPAWVGAAYTPEDKRSADQKEQLGLSDELIAELMEADEYVIGVPMWNFGVPAMLKAYIDQIARVGVTFAYVDGVPQGKLTGKKATFLIASGGKYDAGTATAGLNFVEPYLQAVFGFLGLKDVTFHTAGGASALNYGADRAEFLAPHDAAVTGLAK